MYTSGSAISTVGVAGLMLSSFSNSRLRDNSSTSAVVETLPVTGAATSMLLMLAFTLLIIGIIILRVIKTKKI